MLQSEWDVETSLCHFQGIGCPAGNNLHCGPLSSPSFTWGAAVLKEVDHSQLGKADEVIQNY